MEVLIPILAAAVRSGRPSSTRHREILPRGRACRPWPEGLMLMGAFMGFDPCHG